MSHSPAPEWERRLRHAIAFHDLTLSGDRLLGRVSEDSERARQAVVEVVDDTLAAGVSEATIDAAIKRLRDEQEQDRR